MASDPLVSPNSVSADKFPYNVALTGGIASGKTMGAGDLMDRVNKGRGSGGLPGSTQMNFSAQTM